MGQPSNQKNGAMKNRKGVVAYLLIAFGMAWAIWEILIRLGFSLDNPLFKIASFPAAFAPAIAAFIVRKWITREGFADAGLRLTLGRWRDNLLAGLLRLLFCGVILFLAPLLELGKANFSFARGINFMM